MAQTEASVEITPEMKEVGAKLIQDWWQTDEWDVRTLAERVYAEMWARGNRVSDRTPLAPQ